MPAQSQSQDLPSPSPSPPTSSFSESGNPENAREQLSAIDPWSSSTTEQELRMPPNSLPIFPTSTLQEDFIADANLPLGSISSPNNASEIENLFEFLRSLRSGNLDWAYNSDPSLHHLVNSQEIHSQETRDPAFPSHSDSREELPQYVSHQGTFPPDVCLTSYASPGEDYFAYDNKTFQSSNAWDDLPLNNTLLTQQGPCYVAGGEVPIYQDTAVTIPVEMPVGTNTPHASDYFLPGRGGSHYQGFQQSSSWPSSTQEYLTEKSLVDQPAMLPSPESMASPTTAKSSPSDQNWRPRVASEGVIRASTQRRKRPAKYRCETCGQSLTTSNGLRNHENAHNGVQPYQCQHCPKRFVTKHDKNRHQTRCSERPKP